MAFKMKGPSLHQGTKKYQAAVQAERVASVNMQAASPAKGIGGEKKLDLQSANDNEFETKPKVVVPKTKKKSKVRVMTKEELRAKHKKEGNKVTNKERKAAGEGTAVSRAVKKVTKSKVGKAVGRGVKKLRDATMTTKKDIAQRKEEKPLSAKEQIRSETDVAKRLEMRKKRRSGIADNLEYIFLDGKRPDDKKVAEKQKAVETKKSEMLIKKYGMEQNEHTNYTPNTTKTAAQTYADNQAKLKKGKK